MSVARSQAQTFLRLAAQIRPRVRSDQALPAFIQSLLSRDRSFGSRDRRLYRELLYTTLRFLPWIEPLLDSAPDEALRRLAWLATDLPATRNFRAEFATGEPPAGDRSALLPAWFRPHCPELFADPELETQLRRAPLWLRLQTDDEDRVLREFEVRGWHFRRSPALGHAIELLDEADVTKSDAFQYGHFEVQDLGSQLILETIGVEAGTHWLDACAGAGGKSLQLARLLGRHGQVEAHDVRLAALGELQQRAARARIRNILTTARPGEAAYDGVLVDAPCSGSGTWRRAPHLKWTTTPQIVADRAALQQKLLHRFATCVRPGGRLVYATCSLSHTENEAVIAAFLRDRADFQPEPFAHTFGLSPRGAGLLVLPSRHNTDGFFVASLRRQ